MKLPQLPLSVTLMLTEKCNLRCKYCYEVFSGNMKAKTMPREVMRKGIDRYLNAETLALHSQINWDFVGGEVFVEFELLRDALDYLIQRYRELGLCPKKHLHISLCSNGTLFTPEVRAWCEAMRERIGFFGISVYVQNAAQAEYRKPYLAMQALMPPDQRFYGAVAQSGDTQHKQQHKANRRHRPLRDKRAHRLPRCQRKQQNAAAHQRHHRGRGRRDADPIGSVGKARHKGIGRHGSGQHRSVRQCHSPRHRGTPPVSG